MDQHRYFLHGLISEQLLVLPGKHGAYPCFIMILFWAEPRHHVRETAIPAIDCRITLGCPLSFILSPVFCTFRMHPQHIHPSEVLLPTSESKPLSSLIRMNWSSCCSYPQQSLSLIAAKRIFKVIQVRSGHSVQFSRSVVSDSLRPHESQHARLPCPSPTPGVHSDSCPSSR